MILAFAASRVGYLKVVGSVIDEAIRRGHRVRLAHAPDDKPGEAVRVRDLRALWPHAEVIGKGSVAFAEVLIGDPSIGETLLFPVGDGHPPAYALDFVWEQRMRPVRAGVTRCWATEYHRQMFGPRPHYFLGADCHLYMPSSCGPMVRVDGPIAPEPVTGMTALDALPLVDPATVRARYRLGDRPIVLLFSLKFGGVRHAWRQTTYRWWHYVTLLRALRRYCDRHGCALVVKTREKHRDPSPVHHYADRVIGDESLWPYTSAELVKTAALVVHFQSGAVFEAAAANVAQVSIAMPQPHIAHLGGHDVFFSTAPRTLQNWPGVVQSVGWRDAADLFDRDAAWTVTVGHEREEYASRYCGPLDGRSAARVLDLIEKEAR